MTLEILRVFLISTVGSASRITRSANFPRSNVPTSLCFPATAAAFLVADKMMSLGRIPAVAMISNSRCSDVCAISAGGREIQDVEVRGPSLQSVFIHLTGRELRE